MDKKISDLLWKHGLTPNYMGFEYIADILAMTLNGHYICSQTLTLVAQKHGKRRANVRQSIFAALQAMDIPQSFPGNPSEKMYHQLHYLYQQLEDSALD